MPDIAIAALIRKRAELAGEIESRDTVISQLRADLVHLDAAIRIMSPDTDPEAIRPKKPNGKGCDWFGRGELARMVLDVLRERGPLGHAEIARVIMERKGLPAGDAVAVKRVAGMVKGVMHRRSMRAAASDADEGAISG